MKKPQLIARMIEKHKQKQLDKPQYTIEDLRVGPIIHVSHTENYCGTSIWDSGTKYSFETILPYAIFYYNGSYTHITSNAILRTFPSLEEGELGIKYPKDFDRVMQIYMIKNGLNKNSKLSFNQIKELEDELNVKSYQTRSNSQLLY